MKSSVSLSVLVPSLFSMKERGNVMVEDEQYNLWTSLMDLSFFSGGDVLIDSLGLKVKQEAAPF